MTAMPAATVHDVTMRFRDNTALDGVTTAFEENAITGLLGRNGAGKTTLMQLLTGHRVPASGRIEVFGVSPHETTACFATSASSRKGSATPTTSGYRRPDDGGHAVPPLGCRPRGRPGGRLRPASQATDQEAVPGHDVGIVIGLASRAPLTLFDEPYLGLDAVARQLFYDRLLADYAEHPRTVVLSTHLIEEIAGPLERVLLIDHGRVLLNAVAESLRDSAVTVTGPGDKVHAWVLTIGLTVLLGGLTILFTWADAWPTIGRWFADQSVTTLALGLPVAMAAIVGAASFAVLRRVVP